MLPGAAVARNGDIFIDTRSDVMKIHDADRAHLLGHGIAEPVEVPTFRLDTSRHPQDLPAWEGWGSAPGSGGVDSGRGLS